MKKLIVIVLTIMLLLSLTACGAGSNQVARDTAFNMSGGGGAPAAAPETPQIYPEDDWWDGDPEMSMPPLGEGGSSITDGRKITFSASISLNTKQFDADYVKVYQLIEQAGGFIASESTIDNSALYGKPVGRVSNISARVPAGEYNNFIDAVSSIGDVTQKNKWSEDLTSQYFDTEARIELLELRKDRLMAYILEAERAEDIVAFERELSDVLYDLDYYQGNKRRLDRLVDFSTIDVTLNEVITPDTIGKDGEPLGDRAASAFWLSLDGVGRFLDAFVVGFAAAVPVIVLLLIIGAIIWAIVRVTRPLREKMRDKREARQEARMKRKHPQGYNAPYWQQPGYPPTGYQAPPPPPPPVPKPAEPPKDKKEASGDKDKEEK